MVAVCVDLGRVRHEAAIVAGVTHTVAVGVNPRTVLIDLTVTVVVDAVTHLGGARVDAWISIVAISAQNYPTRRCATRDLRIRGVAVTIAIGVSIQRVCDSFVNQPVAVIINPIACFASGRIDERIRVVAISGLKNPSWWRVARELSDGWIAKSVAIKILKYRSEQPFVDLTVTVVVDAVTDFSGPWMNCGIGVIAIVARCHPISVRIDAVATDSSEEQARASSPLHRERRAVPTNRRIVTRGHMKIRQNWST
ncbi:MAG TPA: hypothetical protein VFV19_19525 [Candidatus Polarisedimenticolaceae bacterium]|nr:hypothetical protein [Candidatus Polarisedimenticolaceae bacterium]